MVTTGITHGLSTVADMFLGPDDVILMPDKLWGNYLMVFALRRGAKVVRYPLLDMESGFDLEGFERVLRDSTSRGKVTILFNFPNNPTGYSITAVEADRIRDMLVEVAEGGCDVVVICDDAYFGLFYDEHVMRESLFTRLAEAHPRLLAIKLDGASKEDFAWGLRVAFITYAIRGGSGAYTALEKKTAAASEPPSPTRPTCRKDWCCEPWPILPTVRRRPPRRLCSRDGLQLPRRSFPSLALTRLGSLSLQRRLFLVCATELARR